MDGYGVNQACAIWLVPSLPRTCMSLDYMGFLLRYYLGNFTTAKPLILGASFSDAY